MVIDLKNTLKSKDLNIFLNRLKVVSDKESFLSPRSSAEIKMAYREKNIFFAFSKQTLLGWIMVIQYGRDLQEVCFAYVFPKYRNKGIFKLLLSTALKNSKNSIMVTFSKELSKSILKNKGVKQFTFIQVIILSKGKFLLKRLNVFKLAAIIRRFGKAKAYYLIYKI